MVDLRCQDGISSSADYCYANKQREILLLGHNNQIYLFFDLPAYLCSDDLIQARLILFKFPCPAKETICSDEKYNLYPLLDFYSVFSCMFAPPDIDLSRRVIFKDDYCCSYTEVDITNIVKDWVDDKIENYGLLLKGNNDSQYISYAPDKYEIVGMRPMIRVTYKETKMSQPLSVVSCSVKVNG